MPAEALSLKDFVVVQMLKSLGARVVVHYHNKGVSNYQQKPLFDFCYKRFFKGVKVILLSELLYSDFSRYVARKDVEICANGIPELFAKEPAFLRKHKKVNILFLSNLIASKGVYVLLDALQILKKQEYAVSCTFVGGETQEISAATFAQAVAQRHLDESVVYAGSNYTYIYCFEEADIFVFPTFYHNESFPLVNLEAMQYKLPVVSTDEGGIRDIVEDGVTGFIVPKENAAALAEKIAVLVDDERLRGKMGEAGYKRYKELFTLSIFETHFVQTLRKVCAQK